ncbi:hypothetical protein AB4343_17445 [Vibrio breoganii]|uniref:Prepilin-type N-terminal cleavage/methylation domain-containing protein n=1 Tax=Vibrio breoganii TaxID=553239 RepID=A0AAP8MTC2_9VIBR|nr:hypothetical protein [Vibrio breoganii]NMO72196.1 hypothetical protein [Vibrio breoganii]NMR71258.1 hypothetical protein [Vibrio breoganii]PMG03751.1 hypothetical protein BCV02_07560 [Vibrio breoganii]PMG04710.1 hypothetical protein BCV08_06350 [Vibrio breoganii]PMK55801.1 hypothetical protein BCT98_01515 [Vibrio breoganii]
MLRAQSGLSLLELVLALGLSSLLLLSSSTLFVHQQQLLSQQIKRTQLLIASHHLATYLRGEVRRAGYAQSSGIEIHESRIALGYKDDAGEYRRVSIWRDALQYKLKYCADSHASELPLLDTCSNAINFSMLNDKLLSMRDFEVTKATDDGSLLRIDYAIALKGKSPIVRVIYVASRNMEVDSDASQ